MTQPNHDEVIAWIDKEIKRVDEDLADCEETIKTATKNVLYTSIQEQFAWREQTELTRYRASLLANRAGLERHKPTEGGSYFSPDYEIYCQEGCNDCPCPTYTDIYNEIRSVM